MGMFKLRKDLVIGVMYFIALIILDGDSKCRVIFGTGDINNINILAGRRPFMLILRCYQISVNNTGCCTLQQKEECLNNTTFNYD